MVIKREKKSFVLIIVDFDDKYYKTIFVEAETKRVAKKLYFGLFKVADAVEILKEPSCY